MKSISGCIASASQFNEREEEFEGFESPHTFFNVSHLSQMSVFLGLHFHFVA